MLFYAFDNVDGGYLVLRHSVPLLTQRCALSCYQSEEINYGFYYKRKLIKLVIKLV